MIYIDTRHCRQVVFPQLWNKYLSRVIPSLLMTGKSYKKELQAGFQDVVKLLAALEELILNRYLRAKVSLRYHIISLMSSNLTYDTHTHRERVSEERDRTS